MTIRAVRRPRARTAIAALAAAATLGGMTACSGSSGSSTSAAGGGGGGGNTSSGACAPSKGKVTLTYWDWVPGMAKVVAVWNKSHPNIHVQEKSVPGANTGAYPNMFNGLKAGTAPDMGQIEYSALPSFRVQNGLTDLSSCSNVMAAKSKFVPWTWSQVTLQSNGVYGIPQDTGPVAMLYRKDLFTKYGISVPKTWTQFAQDAATLHQKDPKAYLTFLSSAAPSFLEAMLWQRGASMYSTSGSNWKVDFTGPQAKPVLDYWQGLIDKKLIATKIQAFQPAMYKALNDGTIATWLVGAWGWSLLRDNAPATAGKWAAAPMPQWNAGDAKAGNQGGSSVAVLRTSKHPYEAAQFLIWLNTDPTALKMENQLGGLYPAATDGLNLPTLQQGVPYYGGQHIFDVFKQASKDVNTNWLWGPTQTTADQAIQDALGPVSNGSSTLTQAMSTAAQKTVQAMKAQGISATQGG